MKLRLAELMAALSMATDYGMGEPVSYAQASCVLAMRLGAAAGLAQADLRDVYHQALLRFIGCNADTYAIAAVVGDEIAIRTEFAAIDAGKPLQVLPLLLRFIRQANADASPLALAGAFLRGLMTLSTLDTEVFPGHCEVAQRFAERLGFGADLVRGLGQLYARWDGKGVPKALRKGWGWGPKTSHWRAAPRSCTTSGGSVCRPPSGASPLPCRSTNGSVCACTAITPNASSAAFQGSNGWPGWLRRRTNESTAVATSALPGTTSTTRSPPSSRQRTCWPR